MQIGIIGLPGSGKTTIFNLLAKGRADVGTFGNSKSQVNVGVAHVPDSRVDALVPVLRPNKVVLAELQFWDAPGQQAQDSKTGLTGQLLNLLQGTDALMHVVRAFEDPSVPHPLGSVDIHRDVSFVESELILSDLTILERRVPRIEDGLKGAKEHQREKARKEMVLLTRIKEQLEQDVLLTQQPLSEEEKREVVNYQFLTSKPRLILANIGEKDIPNVARLEKELEDKHKRSGVSIAAVCGKLELELAELSPEEAAEFRASIQAGPDGRLRLLQTCLQALGLVTFFTIASQEVRAWLVPAGTPVAKAAGKIHSDMERGFIKAEVISHKDLVGWGLLSEARHRGLIRTEGKGYTVRDGDVITILFNR